MNPSWSEVNAAVLAVLGGFARPARSGGQPASRPDRPEVFVDRLFGLRQAERVPEDAIEVRILAGTVVTPLARDLLRARRVGVRVVSAREAELSRAKSRGEWGFAIEARSGQVDALRRILLDGRDWTEIEHEPAGWVIEGEGRGAFVVADEASTATWRANRVEGIRAATACDPDSVTRAVRHLGANVLVVEPAGRSIYLLRQVAERFRQGGAPVVPHDLRTPEACR